jgi:Alpha/beta hydrolase domain
MYSGSSAGPATATGQQVPYTTRILVRAPKATAFSGRVMVEPFNTSGTNEIDAAWGVVGSRLVQNGDAWIGVTTRYSSVGALNARDAARYASLNLASTGQTWGILTDITRLVRSGAQPSPLRGLAIKRVYMTGYSQSAVDIVTYANAINPLETRAGGGYLYDGSLIMGRDASATPLDAGAEFLPKFEFRPVGTGTSPIINVETQTDAQGFSVPAYTNPGSASVRRANSDARTDRFRLYEIPGASHAPKIPTCDHQGTTFPLRYFERAALTNLYAWAEHGTVPPRTPRIKMTTIGTVSTPSLDADGNAVGGTRSPFLDVALARYEGSDTPGPVCKLVGVETPLDHATLSTRYTDVAGYMRKFTRSLDDTIGKRVLLRADRATILQETRTKAEQAFSAP